MSAHKKEQINLLPEKGFETTTAGRVLAWILSTFRIIVIVTEIIVMVAFLSRFWLDAQNTDLTEEIERKQAVLRASNDFVNEFKSIQNRLRIYKSLSDEEGKIKKTMDTVTSYLPDDLFLTAITIDSGQVTIEGSTSNEVSIQQLAVNLQETNNFTNMGIDEIATNSRDPSLLDFSIVADINIKEK